MCQTSPYTLFQQLLVDLHHNVIPEALWAQTSKDGADPLTFLQKLC